MSFLIFSLENVSSEKRVKKNGVPSFVDLELLYQARQKERVGKDLLDF